MILLSNRLQYDKIIQNKIKRVFKEGEKFIESKQNIGSSINMMYVQYVILSIYPLQILINYLGIESNITFIKGISSIEIGNGLMYTMFQIMFLSMLFFSVKREEKNITEFKDEEKSQKIKRNLILYKIFVAFNVIVLTSLMLLTKDKSLLIPSILMILSSIAIYYSKELYLKSYMFDRKRMWLEKVTESKDDENDIDTKDWRYKIWNEEKIKIPISDRKFNTVINLIYSALWGGAFVFTTLVLTKIIFGYFLIKNVLELIENTFSIFTVIDGVCTGVYEHRTRNSVHYRITITDYENKREITAKVKEVYYIESMNRLSVVHGVFSKQLISINNIKLNQAEGSSLIPVIIMAVLLATPLINQYRMQKYIEDEDYKGLNSGYNDEYIDYEEMQKLENDKELLSLSEMGKYETIDISKKDNFNDILVEVDKLYLGKESSKMYLSVTNNTSKGMVLNIDYNTIVTSKDGKNSNILLPGVKYDIEMDILKEYNKKLYDKMIVKLEYTLSDTILNEYLDFTNYNHYPLNVVDENCEITVNLDDKDANISFNTYDQFYNKEDEFVVFQ